MRTKALNKGEDAQRSHGDHTLEFWFLAAEDFHQALYLERKRRERSQRPLYLLLIDVMRMTEEEQIAAIRPIAALLASMTRETDIKGWYSEGRVIGVLFTEINSFDKQEIVKKVKDGLGCSLTPDLMGKITISIHEFPAERREGQGDPPTDPVFILR